MRKRVMGVLISFFLLAPFLLTLPLTYAAVRLGGEEDLNRGYGLFYDSSGMPLHKINMGSFPFPQDNAITGADSNIYAITVGTVGSWVLLYTDENGAIKEIAIDNSGNCFKATQPPTIGECGTGGGGEPVTSLPWDNVTSKPDLVILDSGGNATISGTATVGSIATTVSSGYRRLNVANDDNTVLWDPSPGDFRCSIADNNCYLYFNDNWYAMFGGTGGIIEDNTVVTKYSETDDFNRSNVDPVGSPWIAYTGERSAKIVSNALVISTIGGGTDCYTYYDSSTFANNQYSQVKISTMEDGGPAIRLQTSGENVSGYAFNVYDNNTAEIVRRDDGNGTIIKTCTGTFNSGSTYKLTASGSTIAGYMDGSAISGCSVSDSTYTGGRPGIYLYGSTVVDDWEGGDL